MSPQKSRVPRDAEDGVTSLLRRWRGVRVTVTTISMGGFVKW